MINTSNGARPIRTAALFEASIADIQDTFFKEKLVDQKVPIGRIAPASWLKDVAASLGPFTLAHDDGAPGCR